MAELHWYTGRREDLPVGQHRIVGRAETGPKQPDTVSRQQFRLDCRPEVMEVTSLSAVNPTKVQLAAGGFELLNQGESWPLAPGDKVLLLACDISMSVRVEAALGTVASAGTQPAGACSQQQQSAGTDEGDLGGVRGSGGSWEAEEARSKRPRVKGEGNVGEQVQGEGQHRDEQAARAAGQQRQQAAVAAAAPPVVLVLVGVQGAGKSTFCHNLIERTQPEQQAQRRRWVRINQDSIAGGRRGTREQCLQVAAEVLARGDSVLVDRTGVDHDQRHPFVHLAQQHGVQAHCLMLKLPTKLCQARAASRTNHEGALQGNAAYVTVARMQRTLNEMGDPHVQEGFASVLICESDAEVAAALDAWALYGPDHPDPAAEYARLKPPPPKVNRIENYFRKAAPGEQAAKAPAAGEVGSSGKQEQQKAQPATASGCTVGGQLEPAAQKQRQQAQEPSQQPAAAQGSLAQSVAGSSTGGSSVGDDFQAMMAAAQHPHQQAGRAAPCGGSHNPLAGAWLSGSKPKKRHDCGGSAAWANNLASIAADPESCRSAQPQLWYDNRCVWIADKFPKGREHWLVVARGQQLEGPLDLTAKDVPLLEHMIAVARERIVPLKAKRPGLQFRFGFHAVPSLKQLHMHVVSQDFASAGLKHKKHWNSFTSPFFLDAAWVLVQLHSVAGGLRYSQSDKETLLKTELRCHRCGTMQANMPRLKQHIAGCGAALPHAHLY